MQIINNLCAREGKKSSNITEPQKQFSKCVRYSSLTDINRSPGSVPKVLNLAKDIISSHPQQSLRQRADCHLLRLAVHHSLLGSTWKNYRFLGPTPELTTGIIFWFDT